MKNMKIAAIACLAAMTAAAADFDIRNYGARTDETCTAAIQKALDAADAAGGGRVVVPAGTWTSGTIWLRSRVELHLAKGAVLKGSTRKDDYNRNEKPRQ